MEPKSNSASSITVVVRIRPLSLHEETHLIEADEKNQIFSDGSLSVNIHTPMNNAAGRIRRILKPIDQNVLVFDPPETNPMTKFQKSLTPGAKRVKDIRYAFDRIFGENSLQEEIYEETTANLVDSVFEGYNSTIFAYGATGCGKTYTISGTKQNPGVIYMTMKDLFQKAECRRDDIITEFSLSYLEIYNETIRDLLLPNQGHKPLMLREDADQKIAVPGLTSIVPENVDHVMKLILRGNENRTQSPTEANRNSSRSHAILQVSVCQRPRTADISENYTTATLSIIDLAGSERASATKNIGKRLIEGANINRSLLALGNCINALCDPHRRCHIPYRDSKLTRLLKFSLGGNCRTVMIVCVSPSSQHYDETHNTLKYANRAKEIKTRSFQNIISVDRHVSDYVKAIYELRNEVEQLKSKLADPSRDGHSEADPVFREAEMALNTMWNRGREERMKCYENLKKLVKVRCAMDLLTNVQTALSNATESNPEVQKKFSKDFFTNISEKFSARHEQLSKGTDLDEVFKVEFDIAVTPILSKCKSQFLKQIIMDRFQSMLQDADLERERVISLAKDKVNFELISHLQNTMACLGQILSSSAENQNESSWQENEIKILQCLQKVQSELFGNDIQLSPSSMAMMSFMSPSRKRPPSRLSENAYPQQKFRLYQSSPRLGRTRRSPKKGVKFSSDGSARRKSPRKTVRWRDLPDTKVLSDSSMSNIESSPLDSSMSEIATNGAPRATLNPMPTHRNLGLIGSSPASESPLSSQNNNRSEDKENSFQKAPRKATMQSARRESVAVDANPFKNGTSLKLSNPQAVKYIDGDKRSAAARPWR